jgi:hypothetical protein
MANYLKSIETLWKCEVSGKHKKQSSVYLAFDRDR